MSAVPDTADFYAVVPAAGIGRRMGGDRPKQYLSLNGSPIIEHTLNRLIAIPELQKIVVALADNDVFWPQLALAKHPKIDVVVGGAERGDSVLNGLECLSATADDNDWVLVHDVARPCIAAADIYRLIEHLKDHAVGGILAVPVSDTLKNVSGAAIVETVDRSTLWQAQTPQMFRLGVLREALRRGIREGRTVTDEASAIELTGEHPLVVEGSITNIKITRPQDMALAEYYCTYRQPVEIR